MLGLVRHGLTEASELLNEVLRAEIISRKQAEDAWTRSEKLAPRRTNGRCVAHESINPLEAVMNILFITLTTEGLPEATRSYLELADGNSRVLFRLTGARRI